MVLCDFVNVNKLCYVNKLFTISSVFQCFIANISFYTIQIGFCYQIDLKTIVKYSEFNDGYNYLLFCIDIFTKKLFVEPQITKNAKETTKCLEKIIKKTGERAYYIQADRGGEFYNAATKAMLKKYDIHLYSTYNYDTKAAVCERVQRTIFKILARYMKQNGTSRFIDILQNIVHNYNNTYHESIKMAPADVSKDNLSQVAFNLYYDEPNSTNAVKYEPKYRVGQHVMVSRLKKTFKKG